MSNIKLPALKDALDLLNQTQEVLGRFVSNHRNPSEKDTISELLGMHDCAAGYAARKAVSDTLALLADRERQAGEAVAYTPGEWFDATTVDLMEAFFRSRLPAIREAAKEHGYAIGVHGSLRRDLDLIAAPWRDGASDADTLADAIQNAACGIHIAKHQWEQKPAGRVATSMPICWTHRQGVLSDGHIDLSVLASLPAPQAVHYELSEAAKNTIGRWLEADMHMAVMNGANSVSMPDELVEIAGWLCAAAPSPDGKAAPAQWIDDPHDIEQGMMLNPEWTKLQASKAEQAEAPSDLSVLRRIHKLLVNQVRPALRSPVITKDVDDAAEALSALMSRTQTEAPSDSTLKLAEMILADCGHSTAISTRLRDRVAERIERHLAAQPTEASCRSTNADGHVLLPFEPTDEMEVAAEDAYEESGSPFPNWKAVYRAMRDAAPSPDGKAEQAEAPSDAAHKHREPWIDLDAWHCERCDGKGWHLESQQVGERKSDQQQCPTPCRLCNELGWAGPDAIKAYEAEQAEANTKDPLTPEQEEWVLGLAEKHNLGRRIGQIATLRNKHTDVFYPDVFYTDASYRTHELFCFAAALLSTKELT